MSTIFKVLIFILIFTTNVLANCIDGDCENGHGTKILENGLKYVGEFKDGKRHGQGKATYIKGEFKGTSYIGTYKNDKPHGQGAATYSSGVKYIGGWKDGEYHGQGTYTFPDGKKYVGEFKDNKFNKKETLISSKAKTKKIGNGISINIPEGYKYESITLDKLLSRFKSEVKNLSKDDIKSAEEIGIGKLSKLIFITKNNKNIDFFNKITTSSGYEKISKNFTGGMDEVYNSPNFGKLVFEAVEKNNPNIDLSKISDEEWAKFVDEIFNDKDFDKKYKELSKLVEESAMSPLTNILSEYPIDEPKILIFLGDIQIKDEVFDEINNLNPDSAYEQLIKFLKTIPGSEILKPDELKIQIQKNKFGNLYMIQNVKNVNVDTIFTKPQYSEFVLTTHKNKWFLAFSSCWNKCNNSSTGTDLGLVDILGHTNLFQSIKLSTVDIRY